MVDVQRWTGFSLFAGFNDIFFMSLMFFLSGLFVWHSLQRKGAGKFVRDRLLRLGVPFVLAAALIAPLAYYPTYLQMATHGDFAGFWRQWWAFPWQFCGVAGQGGPKISDLSSWIHALLT